MPGLFHIIDGAQVILVSKGVYRQSNVYARGNVRRLFAKYGSGYVSLIKHGSSGGTSIPNVF